MNRLTLTAPAKINLHLQVLEPRGDGYHDVWTLYQSVDLADEIVIDDNPDGDLSLTVEPQGAVSSGPDNLVLRAASALREHTGVERGAVFHLRKRIPVGAGLGGGSADAAAALVALDRLWGLNLSCAALAEISAGVGSDVGFFLHGGLALGRGRGNEILRLPDAHPRGVLVVVPKVRVSTSEAFSELGRRLTSTRPDATVEAFVAGVRRTGTGDPPWRRLRNDFEEVVTGRWPEIGRVVHAVRETGPLHAAVTGSGAAVFGIYADRTAAREAARAIGSEWRLHVGSTLGNRRAALQDRRRDPREEERSWM